MTNVTGFAILLIIWLLAGCSASRKDSVSHIRPEPEVLTTAEDVGFDYMGKLRGAETGDIVATIAIIDFSIHTDAAGGLAHGWVLLDLQKLIGREKFANALAKATESGRESALGSMEVAATYE
jgi:hypothetical protein